MSILTIETDTLCHLVYERLKGSRSNAINGNCGREDTSHKNKRERRRSESINQPLRSV